MATKVKLIIAQSALIAYTILVMYSLGNPYRHNPLHEAPQRHAGSASSHEVGEESPTVSLKGKYKIEKKKDDCPVCMENKDVVKPFKCRHTLCEECLDGMLKASLTGNTIYYNTSYGVLPTIHRVNLVCPICRAESKQLT